MTFESDGATAMAPIDWVGWLSNMSVRFPDAAVHLPHVKQIGLARHSGSRAGAASAKGSDVAPMQIAKQIRAELLRAGHGYHADADHADGIDAPKQTQCHLPS
jgi:hypothetical protein